MSVKEKQIISSAKKLFEKYGYKRVSVDEIAKNANVTKKTIYSYFKSKEEILKYFLNQELKNMKEIVDNIEQKENSFFEYLHNTICELMKYTTERNFLNIILEESETFKNPIIIDNLKVIEQTIQNYIKEKLEKAKEKGEIEVQNVEVMSFLIYKMYVALLLEWNNESIRKNSEIYADTIINLLKNGLEKNK